MQGERIIDHQDSLTEAEATTAAKTADANIAAPATIAMNVDAPAACANCETELRGGFCYACGQKRRTREDLTVKGFVKHFFEELTELDSKYWGTFTALVFRPGKLTYEFHQGRIERYVSPAKIYLIVSAVYFFFAFGVYVDASDAQRLYAIVLDVPQAIPANVTRDAFAGRLIEYDREIQPYLRFGSVLLMAFAVWLLFRRARRFFVEHLVFALHYYSFDFLLYALLAPFIWSLRRTGFGLLAATIVLNLISIVLPIYAYYAVRAAYGQTRARAVAKAILLFIYDILLTSFVSVISIALAYFAARWSFR